MSMIQEQKQQANTLRKQGLLLEALPIYQGLWKGENKDKYDVAGYLHCLRKLHRYEEAMNVVKECPNDFIDLDWCRNEMIWTHIGYLKKGGEQASIGSILPLANKIMSLNPDDLQKNTVVLFVLKKAKQFKKWEVATSWVDRINPESLEKGTITLSKGTTVWSNYLIWHHHKVRCLIFQKRYQEAIELVDNTISDASQVKKFFLCLKAHAFEQMGETEKAIIIFEELSNHKKTDWWIVHQYANALNRKGEKEKALIKMFQAASLSYKLESIVTLLFDIASLCKELNRMEEFYFHLLLYKLIREKQEWSLKEDIEKLILETGVTLNRTQKITYKDVLQQCRCYWGIPNVSDKKRSREKKPNRQMKQDLLGNLTQVKVDKPFCFIKSSEDSFFCYKSDIKGEPIEGLKVKFDIIPSFDKKKQQESWKAINVVSI